MIQEQTTTTPVSQLVQQFLDFLPTLSAGLLVLLAGLILGWLAKRAVVRLLIWLRLDRLGGRYGWQAAFGKGDVRAALYGLLGNLAALLIILVFLDNALQIWQLTVLSRMVDGVIFYVPNLLLALVIVGSGALLANALGTRVEAALEEENAPRPRLLAKMVKAAVFILVGAIALWQLNVAREIVLAAFLIGFGAIGIAVALAVGIGSAGAVREGWERLFENRKSE